MTLTADGQAIMTVTLDENNQWTAIVPDLFVYEDGKPIVYAWTEDEIEHYELIGTVTEVTEDGTVTILTNKEIPPYEPDKDLGLSMSINIGDCIE